MTQTSTASSFCHISIPRPISLRPDLLRDRVRLDGATHAGAATSGKMPEDTYCLDPNGNALGLYTD